MKKSLFRYQVTINYTDGTITKHLYDRQKDAKKRIEKEIEEIKNAVLVDLWKDRIVKTY